MRLYKFIQVTIILVLLTSCANNIFDNISKLIGKEIRFPKRLYATYNGKDTTTSSIPPIKLLIYKNNQNCSICSTTSLSQYKAIIDYTRENKDFGVVIIYSSNDSNYLDLIYGLEKHPINYPVYLDKLNEFEKLNSNILLTSQYSAFLLNAQNKIVLVGDPKKNSKLWNLYKTTIETITDHEVNQ